MRKLPAVVALIVAIGLAETTGEAPPLPVTSCDTGAVETCNGRDDDCDGRIDEDPVGVETVYADDDGDGFGDPDEGYTGCRNPGNFVADAGDCDDDDPAINPDAEEVGGNDVDEDCDGELAPPCGHDAPVLTAIDASFEPAYSLGGTDQPAAVLDVAISDENGDLTTVAARVWVEEDGDGTVDTSDPRAAVDLGALTSGDEACTAASMDVQYAFTMKNHVERTEVVDIALAVQDEGGNWSEPRVVTLWLE